MTENASQNSDQNQRLKTVLNVYFGAEKQLELTSFTSVSIDLSCGGLYLQTSTPLNVGEDILLRFSLPDTTNAITCKATVAWANEQDTPCHPKFPTGVGVRFVDLSTNNRNAIYRFLEQKNTLNHQPLHNS